MNKQFAYGFLGAALIAGCATTQSLFPEGSVILTVQPQVASGCLTQALVAPYTSASINHLVVKLFTVANSTETPVLNASNAQVMKDIPGANINQAVQFVKLHYNTTYRIRAYAYKSSGTSEQISDDASSSVDLVIGMNDRPTLTALPVGLFNQVFSGQATASGFDVSTGSLSTEQETLTTVDLQG